MARSLLMIVLSVLVVGCASTYEDRYVYAPGDVYDRAGGNYYYGGYDDSPRARVYVRAGWGYDPYDALFWGLRYSYFDPFWYPNFHYGVTYFPRYYHWSSWYVSDYWAWRRFHPYSPWYGSYWDHYYAWRHESMRPRAPQFGGHGDPQRYGSARNAAERIAAARGVSRAGAADAALWRHDRAARADMAWRQDRRLPSHAYAPHARRADTGVRAPGAVRDATRMRSRAVIGAAGRQARSWQRPGAAAVRGEDGLLRPGTPVRGRDGLLRRDALRSFDRRSFEAPGRAAATPGRLDRPGAFGPAHSSPAPAARSPSFERPSRAIPPAPSRAPARALPSPRAPSSRAFEGPSSRGERPSSRGAAAARRER